MRTALVGVMRWATLVVFVSTLFPADATSVLWGLEADDLESGLPVPLSHYRGKVLLIVNVASSCGYTQSTYGYLNELHLRYATQGLSILAFPCNQFHQETGTPADIFQFATETQHARFDLFRKVDVSGPNQHPIYKFLLGEDASCTDEDGSCPSWADSGECERNVAFMHGACKRSCKLCTPAEGTRPPIGWNFESFLITREGEVHTRWKTGVDLTAAQQTRVIERLLADKVEL